MAKSKSKLIFRIGFLVFVAGMLFFLFYIMSNTKAPWQKKAPVPTTDTLQVQ